jgi:protoheme IX farnesyltransferase
MIGWAAATGSVSIESMLMFALIFLWTPPHFWALALFMRNDYDTAGVPMLTVTHGRRATRVHILAYTVILAVMAVGAAFTQIGGPVYLAVALVFNALFLRDAVAIWRRDEVMAEADNFKMEKRAFRLSLWYLFAHFTAILAEAALRGFGMVGWA